MQSIKHSAFSLIELIVTIAIIATLAVIGVPTYSKYRVRTKVAFMYEAANPAKLIVTGDYFNNNYTFTNSDYSANSSPFVTPQSVIIDSIAVSNGIITVTGNAAELGGRNIILVFTPNAVNNEVVWTCAIGSDFLSFAPQNCQNSL